MRKILCYLLTAAMIVIMPLAAVGAEEDPCGEVTAAAGGLVALRESRETPLSVGDGVFVFDIVKTDETGSGSIVFIDGTALEIRASSEIELKDIISSESRDRFNVGIVDGAARVITGSIVKRNSRGFKVTTPSATIGIRGTDFDVSFNAVTNVTSVTVSETEADLTVTDKETGVGLTGSTGFSVTIDGNTSIATVNGYTADLNDIDSIAQMIEDLGGAVSANLSTGETIGGASDGGGGSDSGSDTDGGGGGESGGDGGGTGGSGGGGGSSSGSDCSSSNSSPGR